MTLSVSGLRVTLGGRVLVDDVSLRLEPGRVHAVVGESGSGKTLSALAVMGLLPEGAEATGAVERGGVNLLGAAGPARRQGLAMVLQEPLSALNPVLSVGAQLTETLEVHGVADVQARAVKLLEEVGLSEPAARLKMYPHQLSGGQRQRVSIACALAANPEVLIADEPTTALDASMRGVILELLRTLARTRSLSVWLITHDLGAVRGAADDLTVMYAGRVMAQGAAAHVLEAPRHPYTAALLAARPSLTARGASLPIIEGQPPRAGETIAGCRFNPRCAHAQDRCRAESPALVDGAACHFPLRGPR